MYSDTIGSSVLLVTASEKAGKYFKELLPADQFSPVTILTSAGEAKRLLINTPRDIVIIDTPLKDEFGTQFAITVAERYCAGVILFVKQEAYEQISYKLEEHGVFTLAKPVSRQTVFQSVKLMVATQAKLKALEQKNWTLEEKMKDVRLINRAKWLLIERLKMTESEAHRYIEKTAMDRCVKRGEIAQDIIKMYEN